MNDFNSFAFATLCSFLERDGGFFSHPKMNQKICKVLPSVFWSGVAFWLHCVFCCQEQKVLEFQKTFQPILVLGA
jgi:hypothetical protein